MAAPYSVYDGSTAGVIGGGFPLGPKAQQTNGGGVRDRLSATALLLTEAIDIARSLSSVLGGPAEPPANTGTGAPAPTPPVNDMAALLAQRAQELRDRLRDLSAVIG